MSTPTPAPFAIETRWSRPLIADSGGETLLLVRITGVAATSGTRRAPVDVALVIDRSGSMSGEKIGSARQAVDTALDRLQDDDRVALVAFDDRIEIVHELAHATGSARIEMRRRLRNVDARGSTDLGGGWLAGCNELASMMRPGDGRIHRAILLTDGQANVGIVDAGELSHHAGQLRARGISTTTLGFGLGFDEQILSAVAEAGGGNFEFVAHPRQLSPFFARELGELLQTVATGLTVAFTMTDGLRGHLLSAYPHERTGRTITIDIGDLPAGETIDLVFRVTTIAGASGEILPASVHAAWTEPGSGVAGTVDQATTPVMRAARAMVESIAEDAIVAERSALLLAADARREAMRLDRAGDHRGSRQRMAMAYDAVMAAPMTDDVRDEMQIMGRMMEAPQDMAWSEDVHKSGAASASRRRISFSGR